MENGKPTSVNGTVDLCEMDAWFGQPGVVGDEEIPSRRKFTTVMAIRREMLYEPGQPTSVRHAKKTGARAQDRPDTASDILLEIIRRQENL